MRATLFQQLRNRNRAESAKPAPRNLKNLDASFLKPRQRRLNISEDFTPAQSAYEPSYRQYDKEKMEQEQYYLKNSLNQLQEENLKFKTRIHQLEDCCARNEKLLQEVEKIGPLRSQISRQISEATIVGALKKQCETYRLQLISKDAEMEKMKRNLKHTQMQELLVEKQALSEETIRLKTQLESLIQASLFSMQCANIDLEVQEKLLNLITRLQTVRGENREKEKVLGRLKKQCVQYKSQQLDCEFKHRRENKKLRLILEEKLKEIEQMKPNKRNEDLQVEQNKKLQEECIELKEHILQQNRFIEELERRLQDQQENGKEPESNRLVEVPICNVVESLIMESVTMKQSSPKSIRETAMVQSIPKPKRRIIPVSYQDVKLIGLTMKYRFMAMHIDLNELEDYLFDQTMLERGITTFTQLKDQLQQYPFDLNFKDAVLVAKYIIENENEQLQDQSQQFNPYVKSVMRRLLGNYRLEQVQFNEKLKDVLTRYKPFLINTIQQLAGNKAIRITKDQFMDALTIMQLELTPFEVDYLIVQGIMESEHAGSLNFNEMLKYEYQQQQEEEEDNNFMITQQPNEESAAKGMSIIQEQEAERAASQDSLENLEVKEDSEQQDKQKDQQDIYQQEDSDQLDSDQQQDLDQQQDSQQYSVEQLDQVEQKQDLEQQDSEKQDSYESEQFNEESEEEQQIIDSLKTSEFKY